MTLAEWDDSIETLLFNRPHKPLGIGVELRTLRRQPDRPDPASLQDFIKDPGVERISIVNQLARCLQEAVDRVGQVAGHSETRRSYRGAGKWTRTEGLARPSQAESAVEMTPKVSGSSPI